uniref:DNA-directed RNA polymerase n=1 Tax=Termitomyces sp. K1Aa TaxID=2724994 RepID=A0A8F1D649_9AGAR|nr:RNA polymerase [Termitomyces sp. K1Aa]
MKMNLFFMFLSFFRNFGRGIIRLFNKDIRLNILHGVLIILVYMVNSSIYKIISIINSFSTYHCIVCYILIWGLGQGNGWGAKGSTSDLNVAKWHVAGKGALSRAGRSNPYAKASFNANFDTFAYAFDNRTELLRGDFRDYNTFTNISFMIGKRDGNAVMKNANILLTSRGLIYNKNINLCVGTTYFHGINGSLGYNSFIHTSSVLNDDINNSINYSMINSNTAAAKSAIEGQMDNGQTLSKMAGLGAAITGSRGFISNINQDNKCANINVHEGIDIKHVSNCMLNRNLIDTELINKIDYEFYNFLVYFKLIHQLLKPKLHKQIINNLRSIFKDIGVSNNNIELLLIEIQEFVNPNSNNICNGAGYDTSHSNIKSKSLSSTLAEGNALLGGTKKGERISVANSLLLTIEKYADNRGVQLNVDRLDKLVSLIKNSLELKNKDLDSEVNKIIKQVEEECKEYALTVQYKSAGSRKHPGRQIEWTQDKYEKEFNNVITHAIKNINQQLFLCVYDGKDINYDKVTSLSKSINDRLLAFNDYIVELLFFGSGGKGSDNNKENLANTIGSDAGKGVIRSRVVITKGSTQSMINKIDKANVSEFLYKGKDNTRDLQTFLNIINEIENMDKIENKIDKLSSLNTPLLKTIKYILSTKITPYDKQVAIEKALIDYELDYFNRNMDSSEARYKILHSVYPKFKKAYDGLINEYKSNNYFKLKKLIKILKSKSINGNYSLDIDNDSKEFYNLVVVLIIMYLGSDKCISYSFSQLVSLLNSTTDDHKRTNIAINLGNKVIRLIKNINIKEENKLAVLFSLNELRTLITKLDDRGFYWLGDTLLHLIIDNCDIILEEIVLPTNKVKDSYTILRFNDKFISDLTVGSVNLVQLPMLSQPREIDSKGNYYPYINTESTNLHLFEGRLIKSKYNVRDLTQGSELLYQGINYLNSMKFQINKLMLNFVLNEWENKESKLFKGFNVYQPILEGETKDIKMTKLSSNSKYHLYSNIINLATLYKDQEFYLPVFVDFRGRIYPLSNYLNYQGGDLARSLILFADGYSEKLNETGIECLNIYLANLAGYDKLPWNRRLSKVNGVVDDYLDSLRLSKVKYIEDNIDRITEPFQFMSIMYAKLYHIRNANTLISNPILFDASCSGIQHIASLTLEKELANNVNVISEANSPKEELPQDFYSYALDKIRTRLLESDIVELRDIKLNRKMIKRSVMTIPYNISMAGIGEHLMEHFESNWVLKEKFIKIPGKATISGKEVNLNGSMYGNLTKIIYFVLTKELPSLKLLTDYFNGMIDICTKLNLPLTWVTPAGLKISYTNMKFETTRIKANLLPSSNKTTIKLPTDSMDVMSMKRSFMPNFVHSLDAANVHLLLNSISMKGLPIYTIHDCFAGTPNNMLLLEKMVKEAFIEIYFKDEGYLNKLHKHFREEILSATDTFNSNNNGDNIYVVNRMTKEVLRIPNLPTGYKEKNETINTFIKGLFNSKYFIG